MRDIFCRRATGKHKTEQSAGNMASTNNTTENGGMTVGGVTERTDPVPEWDGDHVMLKDFASKRKVPGFARVVKGSYLTIGPSSKFIFQKQHHDIYIHTVKVGVKVLAHCVRRVDMPGNRRGQTLARLFSTDQRLTVPITYQGWFELLSEDGKSARPITSVPELAKVFPQRCLVRENLKGYVASGEGRMTFDKSKIIPAGEQLKLCRELSLPAPSEGKKVKLLQCIDSKGENVYLSFDQRALFTPIAEENDFTGVFNIRDIIRRFRLPLTVKLTQGVSPRVPDSKFSGIIRLDWVYSEETAFICPIERNHVRLLPVPCDSPLHLVAASNQEEMCNSEMFRSMQAKCSRMVNNYNNTLHLIVSLPESMTKTQNYHTRASSMFSKPSTLSSGSQESDRMRRSKSREDMLMDEIDDLYGYVRDGGAAPPPKVKFQYDPDEDTYWEEPAYESLDEFRARLKAMESGQAVKYSPFYRPADPTHLKGLIGGSGEPKTTPPCPARVVFGDRDASDGQGTLPDTRREQPPVTKDDDTPPPLPPRPADMITSSPSSPNIASTSPVIGKSLWEVKNTTTDTINSTKQEQNRRVSAPFVLPQRNITDPSVDTNAAGTEASLALARDIASTSVKDPPKRVSRSDSEPSISIKSALAATAKPNQRQEALLEAAKPDWKERLRRFNAMEGAGKEAEKEGSSTASSGSVQGQKKVAQKLAKDFKDSDISSRTKASSESSGARDARKRMQTLYL